MAARNWLVLLLVLLVVCCNWSLVEQRGRSNSFGIGFSFENYYLVLKDCLGA